MLLFGHEGRWDYKNDRNTFVGSLVAIISHSSLSAGCVSLFLDELNEFETGVEEAVDAVGETGLFGAREAGGGGSGHTPTCLSSVSGMPERERRHGLVPTHACHFVD